MKTTVVTVTYGDRFDYLKVVINALRSEKIEKLIVVCNGVNINTLDGLEGLKKDIPNLHILNLNENTGSANGFYQGIKCAYDNGAEYIWLLDDDNMPVRGALNALKSCWKGLENINNPKALLSYRDDRELYRKAIEEENPRAMLGKNNSFLGFHVSDVFYKIIKKHHVNKEPRSKLNYGQVIVAPYGGLFFHKTMIELIGLPDPKYFLYGDDYDFSYRITNHKGFIYLVMNSLIKDLETSFHIKKDKKKTLGHRFLRTESKDKIFYATRNGMWFEKNFITNQYLYYFNLMIYMILTFIILTVNYNHFWKFVHILKGLKAGFKK